jgi:hypothetical protein
VFKVAQKWLAEDFQIAILGRFEDSFYVRHIDQLSARRDFIEPTRLIFQFELKMLFTALDSSLMIRDKFVPQNCPNGCKTRLEREPRGEGSKHVCACQEDCECYIREAWGNRFCACCERRKPRQDSVIGVQLRANSLFTYITKTATI